MPFGDYESIADCIEQNQDKDDPAAFCAELERIMSEDSDLELSLESVKQLCPRCADNMEKLGIKTIKPSAMKTIPDELLDGLLAKAGFKTDVNKTRQNLEGALQDKLGRHVWVDTFDPDEGWVVYEDTTGHIDGSLFKVDYQSSGDTITIADGPVAVERDIETKYVEKSQILGELTGPIVKKDSKRQIAYAAVLVPGEPDSDGETVTKQKIEEVAHDWMMKYRNIDEQHTLNNLDALPVESHVLRQAEQVNIGNEVVTLPAGTWVLASKFNDPGTWADIESGAFTGYSVMGVKRAVIKDAAAKSATFAFKKTLLEDLGDDWVATHVSVVKEPAVPKAKWFALKSASDGEEKPKLTTWLKEVFTGPQGGGNGAIKEGRRFSKATISKLRAAYEELGVLIKEAEQESASKKEMDETDVRDAIKEALK